MSAQAIHFYDAATPGNVPSGVHAAVYVNGEFAWPPGQKLRMGRIFSVSVLPDPEFARQARCIDVETGAATPEDVVPFARRRWELGFNDATAYVNRSNWPAVRALVDAAGVQCRYWVATLDGTMQVPGAWAVQYQGGENAPYDLSVLYGTNDFVRP